ncbi:MAG: hypothetical protein H7296_08805 [Bacteroidia bacterium]|nr:hypothetical protein [Bacteroidia bacterium]
MEAKPDVMPQFIYDWATLHLTHLKSLYEDFCLETGNVDKTEFNEFCRQMYFECNH